MSDIPLTAPIVPNPGSQAQSAYAKYVSDGFINVPDHAARDALHTGVTTVGTLVRTLNDGIVWEVASVGPVVYAAWSGSGGVTSFNTRTGAVVPVTNDYAASQVSNDSSVSGTGVKGALNTLLSSLGTLSTTVSGLVTGVSSVFGRTGAVVAAVGDYAASKITNDSSTVTGAHVSDALDALKSSIAALVTGVSSVYGRTGAIVAAAGDYSASKINNDSATVAGTHVSDALDALKAANGALVFQTVAQLAVYDATALANATLAETAAGNELYDLFSTPGSSIISATDGVNIVQPTTPNTARWVRHGLASSYTANWYVNAATGSDTNDGLTAGTAFATIARLCHVLCPRGARHVIKQNTAIHIAAGTYESLDLFIAWDTTSSFTFDVFCDYTSGPSITLNSVVNTVESPTAPVRGRITTASGTFSAGKRIRSTSGANIGAVTFPTTVNSATDVFVKHWFMESTFANVDIANGTTCVVDTLGVTINRVNIRTTGTPTFPTAFRLHDAILPNSIFVRNELGSATTAILSQCEVGAGIPIVSGILQFRNCRFPATISTAVGSTLIFFGCEIEGFQQCNGNVFSYASCCFNGGSFGFATLGYVNLGACEWVNGNAGIPAISSNPAAGVLNINGQQFGFGTPWAVGIRLYTNGPCTVIVGSVSQLAIPATVQIQVAGKNYLYANVPFAIPRAGVTFAVSLDTAAISTIPNAVTATLSDVQAATDIIAAPAVAAQWTVKAYLEILVAGGVGKIIVNEIHTGPSGTVQTTPITAPIDIATVGNGGQGVVAIATSGSGAVQYSVTSAPGIFTKGSLSYALRISVTQEPN